jgi:hypothetical protein
MKYLIILSLSFCFLKSQAQVDSTQIKTSLTLQANDWLFVSEYIKYDDSFERLYDSIKARIWPLVNPNSTVTGKIDSISVGNLLEISRRLRSAPFSITYFVFSRINNAIRAVSNSYLQSQLDIIDQAYTDQYTSGIAGELARLKRVHQ